MVAQQALLGRKPSLSLHFPLLSRREQKWTHAELLPRWLVALLYFASSRMVSFAVASP